MTDPTTTPTPTETRRWKPLTSPENLAAIEAALEPEVDEAPTEPYHDARMVVDHAAAWAAVEANSFLRDAAKAEVQTILDDLAKPAAAVSAAAPDEREATPDEAHDIGYTKGHTDGYREAMAALAARPAPTVSGADDQAAAVKAVEQYPTLTVTAWNATPEQAEAIFEAAMDAAYAAAGDIALDGVATLVRRTVADTPAADDEGGQE